MCSAADTSRNQDVDASVMDGLGNPAPLLGLRVVTLAQNVPGPAAAARLRELGASVVKVEPPNGDPLAHSNPAWYEALAAEQEVVRLDLKDAAGRARVAGGRRGGWR